LSVKIRKVLRTAKGTRMISLTEYIPDDWQFVQITGHKIDDKTIQLTIRKIEVQTNGNNRATPTNIQ
jgi:hypothetical protein